MHCRVAYQAGKNVQSLVGLSVQTDLNDQQNTSSTRVRHLPFIVCPGRSRVRIPLAPGFFRGRVIPVTSKLALQWLPYQAPGVIGSVLGLVDPVSVYCDWVRSKVWSVTVISVLQHVKLSSQIRP